MSEPTLVRLDQLKRNDVVRTRTPVGTHVQVEEIAAYPDEAPLLRLRWWRPQTHYHDGREIDSGVYLGSFGALPPDTLFELVGKAGPR